MKQKESLNVYVYQQSIIFCNVHYAMVAQKYKCFGSNFVQSKNVTHHISCTIISGFPSGPIRFLFFLFHLLCLIFGTSTTNTNTIPLQFICTTSMGKNSYVLWNKPCRTLSTQECPTRQNHLKLSEQALGVNHISIFIYNHFFL